MTEKIVEKFNDWISSTGGFLQAVIISVIWNVAVILGWDAHGFLYLFIATEFSFITQFTLAIIARKAKMEAHSANETNGMLLKNSADMMQALLLLAERNQALSQEIIEDLEDIENELEND